MSRCFAYPPPGYVRTPVAVAVAEAETAAKLQKEREKVEKKKEKRSDKKALQKGETSKHSKHSHKKRKHEDVGTSGLEPKTFSKESVEQLEKSGLSEEQGAPFFVRAARDSPESSQDSSKRRKIVLPSPSQAKNGSVLRIKIKRDQDSPRGVEQPSVKQVGLTSTQLSKPNSIQQHNKVSSHQQINIEPQVNEKKASTQHPSMLMRRDDQQMVQVVQQIVKPPVGNEKQASTQHPSKLMRRDDQQMVKVVQQIAKPPVGNEKQVSTQHPSKLMRRDDQQMVKVVQQIDPKLSVKPPVGRVDLQRARVGPLVKMSQKDQPGNVVPAKVTEVTSATTITVKNQLQRPSSSVSKEEPSSSGRNTEAIHVPDAKQSKSDRKKSRKAEKKEKKLKDLFFTWNPPSFEMEGSDVSAQDWLFGSTRISDASMTNCRASDGSVPFQSLDQQPSLQPRATFLPDLHIYQLPYVVPY